MLPLYGEAEAGTAESENLSMCRHLKRENREVLLVSVRACGTVTARWNGQETSQAVLLS